MENKKSHKLLSKLADLERTTRLELATSTLARWRSTMMSYVRKGTLEPLYYTIPNPACQQKI